MAKTKNTIDKIRISGVDYQIGQRQFTTGTLEQVIAQAVNDSSFINEIAFATTTDYGNIALFGLTIVFSGSTFTSASVDFINENGLYNAVYTGPGQLVVASLSSSLEDISGTNYTLGSEFHTYIYNATVYGGKKTFYATITGVDNWGGRENEAKPIGRVICWLDTNYKVAILAQNGVFSLSGSGITNPLQENAIDVIYDNSNSGLDADNVQGAIDYIKRNYAPDSELNVTSGNPVQNKVVSKKIYNNLSKLNSLTDSSQPLEFGNITMGSYPFVYDDSTTRVRTPRGQTVWLNKGDKVYVDDGYYFYIGEEFEDTQTTFQKGWNSEFYILREGNYILLIRKAPEEAITVEEARNALHLEINNIADIQSTEIENGNMKLYTGFYYADGYYSRAENTVEAEKTTEFIPVEPSTEYEIIWEINFEEFNDLKPANMWIALSYLTEDSSTGLPVFIKREEIHKLSKDFYGDGKSFRLSYKFTTTESTTFVRGSSRTYNHPVKWTINKTLRTSALNEPIKYPIDYSNPFIKSVAHRGYSMTAPENTIPAYILAKKAGFEYAECDVEWTSDNIPVLLHDSTINRTVRNTDGTSLSSTVDIHDITLEEAKTYDFGIWKNVAYTGTKIPTLEEFLVVCKKIGIHPYIEIKTSDFMNNNNPQEKLQIIIDLLEQYDMVGNSTIISFNSGYLSTITELNNEIRLGFVYDGDAYEWAVDKAVELSSRGNKVFLDVSTGIINSISSFAKERKIPLETYSINEIDTITNINGYISGIGSDWLIAQKVIMDNELDN